MYKISNIKLVLLNFLVFFSTIPFVAPVPISADVQYPVFFIAFLIVFIDIISGRFALTKFEVYFLSVAILSLVYVNPFQADVDYSIFKRVGLLCSFSLFYVFTRYWKIINPSYLLIGFFVNFIAVLMHLFMPDLFVTYASTITRTIKIVAGSRGVSGLMPEPGFLGAMSVFFMLSFYVLFKEGRVNRRVFYPAMLISLMMLYLSKSGTATVLIIAIFISAFISSRVTMFYKISATILITVLLVYTVHSNLLSGRGITIAKLLITDPYAVFVEDISVAKRTTALAVGVISVQKGYLLGHGGGSLSFKGPGLVENTALKEIFPHTERDAGAVLSAFGQYTFEMGLFFLLLIAWSYLRTRYFPYVFIVRTTSFFYLLASFSILFPPLWILIGITDIRNVGPSFSNKN